MGFTAIPSGDIWVQIGTTQTPTTGSSVSFTSIPAVKKLRLVVDNLQLTAAATPRVTLNNDTSTSYVNDWVYYDGTRYHGRVQKLAYWQIGTATDTVDIFADWLIDYANLTMPKAITQGYSRCNGTTLSIGEQYGTYQSTAVINRLDLTLSTSTFSATNTGTIAIYGAF